MDFGYTHPPPGRVAGTNQFHPARAYPKSIAEVDLSLAFISYVGRIGDMVKEMTPSDERLIELSTMFYVVAELLTRIPVVDMDPNSFQAGNIRRSLSDILALNLDFPQAVVALVKTITKDSVVQAKVGELSTLLAELKLGDSAEAAEASPPSGPSAEDVVMAEASEVSAGLVGPGVGDGGQASSVGAEAEAGVGGGEVGGGGGSQGSSHSSDGQSAASSGEGREKRARWFAQKVYDVLVEAHCLAWNMPKQKPEHMLTSYEAMVEDMCFVFVKAVSEMNSSSTGPSPAAPRSTRKTCSSPASSSDAPASRL